MCAHRFTELSVQEITSTVIFNPLEQSSAAQVDEEDAELKGPVVRSGSYWLRTCGEQMT